MVSQNKTVCLILREAKRPGELSLNLILLKLAIQRRRPNIQVARGGLAVALAALQGLDDGLLFNLRQGRVGWEHEIFTGIEQNLFLLILQTEVSQRHGGTQ